MCHEKTEAFSFFVVVTIKKGALYNNESILWLFVLQLE